eukprot:TRINITY_DN1839_c0_g1_i3.p1 TRINITY_DN1839_c0_g1~~TRINITY_DN1839_c0_g1_i3.p1  ORF type:complete len:216 (-),score=9.65 TRINITY_DN1839_c0_g1_i3:155-802(-)
MKWLDNLSGWLILAAGCLLLAGCAGLGQMERGANDDNALSPAQAQQEITQFVSSYRLGSGDVLSVRVFGEPDLSQSSSRLSDSGTIFLPTIGELGISGFTLGDVERLVVERLRGRILVNPKVSVSIEQYRPFFINGMVRSPGAYPFQPGLTVRKAVSLAGGLQERASLRKMFVIRAGDPAQLLQRVELATTVLPGDVVTIEESFFQSPYCKRCTA